MNPASAKWKLEARVHKKQITSVDKGARMEEEDHDHNKKCEWKPMQSDQARTLGNREWAIA